MKRDAVQKAVNDAIKRRDGYICVTCGSSQDISASHFYSCGSTPNLRYYPSQIHAQCFTCHRKHEDGGKDFAEWFYMEKFVEYVRAQKLKNKICKLTASDKQEIKKLAKSYEKNNEETYDNLDKINKIVERGMGCL